MVCTHAQDINKPTGATVNFEHVITVDPQFGKDTNNCISGEEPCKMLSWAFQTTHRMSSTKYFLEKGTHVLNTSTDLFDKSISSLAFVGNATTSSEVVIHCTRENTGLAFEGVKTIIFSYLTFYNCSALRNSTTRDYRSNSSNSLSINFYDFQVGFYFYLCTDVTMVYVNVSNSPNATGVVMYDTNGTNKIIDSTYQNNIILYNTTTTPSPNGGGGGSMWSSRTVSLEIRIAIIAKRARRLSLEQNISFYDVIFLIIKHIIIPAWTVELTSWNSSCGFWKGRRSLHLYQR